MAERQLTSQDYIQICQEYVDGYTLRKVGKNWGLSPQGVAWILKKTGTPTRSAIPGPFTRLRQLETELKVLSAHGRGDTPQEIAEQTNLAIISVRRMLRRHNVPPHLAPRTGWKKKKGEESDHSNQV